MVLVGKWSVTGFYSSQSFNMYDYKQAWRRAYLDDTKQLLAPLDTSNAELVEQLDYVS
jgi:hypothetical protein